MKIIKFYTTTVVLLVLALLLVDLPALAQRDIKGEGDVKSQTRNVSGFKGIDVSGGFAVELTQGNKEGVRIEAQENLFENIKTEVRNGVLHIYNEGGISTNKGLKAYITVKELNKINISGGVKVTGNSTFKTDAMNMDLSGGSKVTLAIDTKKLDADMSGASKVQLTGRADEVDMDLSGASSLDATELEAKRMEIEASGASKAQVYAKDVLNINASGASKVAYKGSPSITSDVSAAAKISKM